MDGVQTRVLRGGELSSRKGLNLPETRLGLAPITPKDREDLAFAVGHDVELAPGQGQEHPERVQREQRRRPAPPHRGAGTAFR